MIGLLACALPRAIYCQRVFVMKKGNALTQSSMPGSGTTKSPRRHFPKQRNIEDEGYAPVRGVPLGSGNSLVSRCTWTRAWRVVEGRGKETPSVVAWEVASSRMSEFSLEEVSDTNEQVGDGSDVQSEPGDVDEGAQGAF